MYFSPKCRAVWLFGPLILTVVAYGITSWIFNLGGDRDSRGILERLRRSARSSCEDLYPTEFFEGFQSQKVVESRCKPPFPSDYDCSKAKEVFRRKSKKTDSCNKVMSSASFEIVKCGVNSKAVDCWKKVNVSASSQGDPQCHMFYESSGQNKTIHNLPFTHSRGLAVMYSLQHHFKLNSHTSHDHHIALVVCSSASRTQDSRPTDEWGPVRELNYRVVVFETVNKRTNGEEGQANPAKTSVNVLLIPSLSRAGFYRSLPNTSAALKSIKDSGVATVLDFSLYQSQDLGELTNYLKALVGGQQLRLRSEGGDESDKCQLLKAAEIKGQREPDTYMDIEHYMDTDCQNKNYKVNLDCFSQSWSRQRQSLGKSFRDFTCRLFAEKFLTKTSLLRKAFSSSCSDKWLSTTIVMRLQLTFTEFLLEGSGTKLASDGTGLQTASVLLNVLRTPFEKDIQHSFSAIDLNLAHHIPRAGKLTNSITVILSERGLIHPGYSRMSGYARIEQENPIFFLLLPSDFVHDKTCSQFVSVLQTNQAQLLTIEGIGKILESCVQILTSLHADQDSHAIPIGNHSLRHRRTKNLYNSVQRGLQQLDTINAQTCQSLTIQRPNLCLCEGKYIEFNNDTVQVGTAEFAIGEMNKRLRRAIKRKGTRNNIATGSDEIFTHSPYGHCGKLQGIAFKNVRISYMNHGLRTMMDLYVRSEHSSGGNFSDDHPFADTFNVIVDRIFRNNASALQLVKFHRLPSENNHDNCNSLLSYNNEEDSLCVCNDGANHKYTFSKSDALAQLSMKQFGMPPLLINIHGTCLFLVIRHYRHSAAFEAGNVCEGRVYHITLHLHSKGMLLSGDRDVKMTLRGRQETFMAAGMQASYHKQDVYVYYTTTVSYLETN